MLSKLILLLVVILVIIIIIAGLLNDPNDNLESARPRRSDALSFGKSFAAASASEVAPCAACERDVALGCPCARKESTLRLHVSTVQ